MEFYFWGTNNNATGVNNNHGDSRGIMKFLVRNAAPAGQSIQAKTLRPLDKIVNMKSCCVSL